MKTITLTMFSLGALALALGCAGPRTSGPDLAPRPAPDPTVVPFFDGADGARLSWSEVVQRAATADVVVIGEMHGHETGLAVAAALFEEIAARVPHAALSMEFFERDAQTALDDYLTGVTDEDAFREAAGRTRGNYPAAHRAMVETARAAGLPVYAANAPRRYVRLARLEGFERLEELTWEQRRLFMIPESLSEGGYRDRFFEIMGGMAGHGDEDEELGEEERARREDAAEQRILSFFRSQNLWDATMAETILEALAAGRRPVVQVVGRFHSDFDGGLIRRVRDEAPDAAILTLSMLDDAASELNETDRGRADIVVHVGGYP